MGSATGSSTAQQMSTLTPEQQSVQLQALGLSPDIIQQLMSFGTGDLNEMFQKAYVDPAMLTFNQDVIPAIQERFGGDTGASSALNQTLAQSAENMGTMLGGQMGDFMTQQQNQQINTLMSILGLGMQPSTENVVTQKSGWLDPVLGLAGQGIKAYYGGK